MITAIIPCFRRFKNFEKVLKAWLALKNVNEVIVYDGGGTFKTDLPILVFQSNIDQGVKAIYALAQFAKNKAVIFADDDVVPLKGLDEDLLKYYNGKNIVGVIGRQLTAETYYKNKGIQGKGIKEPVKVGYLAQTSILMNKKPLLKLNLHKCPHLLMTDWWFQYELKLEMLVIPTKNYQLLPEAKDADALSLSPEMRAMREKYYKKWGYPK